ncbi:nitrate/nitrite two-component system sensor histidine kinase NarX [Dickeya lacustris]|uniref:Sensor protein n=1 Tax=Dickeya lacustris TaxID=2259638 RepID=A0ABY8G8U0_9GAMM|nr:nitrate/nitrite two-component system sensor histidine kinase NarX [Dickeya lacustris]WFN56351.1 nitrate/nitrite two-component system sensor histidine kinase NarX [Dickeya lacustris]
MFRRFRFPLSLVNQVVLLMLLQGLLGIAGMAVSSWMSQGIQGNAHAINKAGSLRMQSYRLLSLLPLDGESQRYLQDLEQDAYSDDLQQAVARENLGAGLTALQHYWAAQLKPQLRQASHPHDASAAVADFVHQLDALVLSIDQKTEAHLRVATQVQRVFIGIMLLLLLLTFFYLRHRLLSPLHKLMAMARAIGQGEFTQRVALRGHDEMSTLAHTLNTMSDELSAMYRSLERRVAEKTADLRQKNETLAFLYRSSRRLHTSAPLCSRLLPVLDELSVLIPLYDIRLQLYEDNHQPQLTASGLTHLPDPQTCPDNHCPRACHRLAPSQPEEGKPVSWDLHDKLGRYGRVLAWMPAQQSLSPDQHQLLNTLLEQLTGTLALERQSSHRQQLMLMEERATIARELHDSIAQSLSCLKIQLSCLQMQHTALPDDVQQQLAAMRDEINTAYRQLRELLTTFRLQLSESGLLAALRATVTEFNSRLGYDIELHYLLPLQSVSAHQGIHLLQIIREALSNIYKHAQASAVTITLRQHQGHIELQVRDNGIGISDDASRLNHYGLIIMRDRARSLNGELTLARLVSGGTEVCVRFLADYRQPNVLTGEQHA